MNTPKIKTNKKTLASVNVVGVDANVDATLTPRSTSEDEFTNADLST